MVLPTLWINLERGKNGREFLLKSLIRLPETQMDVEERHEMNQCAASASNGPKQRIVLWTTETLVISDTSKFVIL